MFASIPPLDIRDFPFLAGLSKAELDHFVSLLLFEKRERGFRILTAGENIKRVFFVRHGTIKIGWIEDDGREIIINLAVPGAVLGDICAVDGLGHSANADVLERCSLWPMSFRDFNACVASMPALNRNLMLLLTKRARFTTDRYHARSAKNVPGRIAIRLLSLGQEYGVARPDGGVSIPLRLTHDVLAGLTGASRLPVSLALASLQKNGAIRCLPRSRFVLRNLKTLRALQ